MAGVLKRISPYDRKRLDHIDDEQSRLVKEIAQLSRDRQAILDAAPPLGIHNDELAHAYGSFIRLMANIYLATNGQQGAMLGEHSNILPK